MFFKNAANTVGLCVCYLTVSVELSLELHNETLLLSISEAVLYHRNTEIVKICLRSSLQAVNMEIINPLRVFVKLSQTFIQTYSNLISD
jgi:hypothetical protein